MGQVIHQLNLLLPFCLYLKQNIVTYNRLIGDVNDFQHINHMTDLESCNRICSSPSYHKKLQVEILSVNCHSLFWLGNINNLSKIV